VSTTLTPAPSQAASRQEPLGENGLDLSSYDSQAYNILSPVLRLDTAAPYLRFRAVEVRLDPDANRGDCYAAPGTKWTRDRRTGELLPTHVAPAKPGLLKIASATGLVIDPHNSRRIKPDACERCIDMARATGQAVRCGDCPSRYDVAYQHIGALRPAEGYLNAGESNVAVSTEIRPNASITPMHAASEACAAALRLMSLRHS